MSHYTAVRVARPAARPAPRAAGRPGGPRLRVVAAPANTRSRAGLTIGCLVLLAVGLVGLLLLNVSLEKGAFVRRHQQSEIEKLQEQRQALLEELARYEAPQALAGRAVELGMVEAPNAAFIRKDGSVLGDPLPGVASKSPNVTAPGVPAPGRGSGAGPAAGAIPGKGTAAGTAQTSAKVTGAGKASATTTATSGTPTGQKAGAARSAAPTGAKPTTKAAVKPTTKPTTKAAAKPTTRRAATATATP